ncbi:MAG: sulfotransferase [Magnetococcales bacterium]|nr:sulfotransferase [Magnetococcales bacterium]
MNRPNFFIIGAPKCGTTSMAAWLAAHPQIYMSPIKEPHFFNNDHQHGEIDNLADYNQQFANATEEQKAIGEASVWYLTSTVAVANILQFNPDAKFIVMLRNPIEMAESLHDQMLFSQYEHIEDFSQAWYLQEQRKSGFSIVKSCVEPQFLQYGERCKLGEQLQRLYTLVAPERVHVITMDRLKIAAKEEYQKTLQFLHVADDGRNDFSVHNLAKSRRSLPLRKVVEWLGGLKTAMGISGGLGILNAIEKKNQKVRKRPPLPPQTKEHLQNYFRDDIHLLEKLLNRDFSHWLKP